ncbi:hypothetical protein LH462_10150 [Laribacter hongkongensis]|uniref:hypothetical protein n=1 Tax=Laribacter hongkongensis TaxID=168471 RepID=UPI001EFEC618|nr:hypothetical protein [Laribacter hongkongensis]MCG9101359.1 hypothetical protein [Laribacter hongkongensis]MCG9104079.1 hypothetical protein [Laribacter hongkongensis]MCG9113445.1 hypothetical protein [Laribacter hongkongensis]MCG9118915.1 hypothetical protein [Laribacter hongkongensis]
MEVLFLIKGGSKVACEVADAGFDHCECQGDDLIFASLKQAAPSIIVFDSIEVSVDLVRKIRAELDSKVVIFTNLTVANRYAHMVVLPRSAELAVPPERRFCNESFVNPSTGALHFYGPAYWILRQEFYAYQEVKKDPRRSVSRILLAFGGSDPTNLTSAALNILLKGHTAYSIDVLLGSHFKHDSELAIVMGRYRDTGSNVFFHRNAKNVAELMFNADLSVTAAGMSMFESLCVGTPVIAIPQDRLQRDTYQDVIQLLDPSSLDMLPGFVMDKRFSWPDSPVIQRMDIGMGKGVLIENIVNLSNDFC